MLAWANWFHELQRISSLFKMLSIGVASAVFLVVVSALGQLGLPHLRKGGRYPAENKSLPSSVVDYTLNLSLDFPKVFMHSEHHVVK